MYHIKQVLTAEQIQQVQQLLAQASWVDGKVTAGSQAALNKNNQQLPEDSDVAKQLRTLVLTSLSQSAQFFSAALPKKIYPPLFNRYAERSNSFGNHVDNAIRTHPITAQHVRTDLSFTLFLNEPDQYQGGELVMEDGYGGRSVKLPAGDLILYPSYSVHRVNPVMSGERIACFSWLESMVQNPQQRSLLYDLDMSIVDIRAQQGDTDVAIQLTHCYHNLLRMWATP